MATIILGLLFGFALLVWSADRFVIGAVGLAHHFKISPIIIGIVILGFGTSAPELLISAISAWKGNSGLAIGNAIGSNITNISLILGVTALLTPLLVARKTLRREFIVLFISTGIAWLVLQDRLLSAFDGLILLAGLLVAITFLAVSSENQTEQDNKCECTLPIAFFWTLVGLTLLLISSHILVSSSVKLAQFFGVSDLVIGLTIVAIGTSLPELAASITGAIKHHTDLAIGNVVGSNIFNTLGVIGIPGLIQTYRIPSEALTRDFPIMIALTILLFVLALITHKGKGMYRLSGITLLACFIAFQTTLYVQNVA